MSTGLQYRVNEMFFSIQGEGYWAGTPMFFIRLSGCNLACKFCDTPHDSSYSTKLVEEIVQETRQVFKGLGHPFRVCITGGEPYFHELPPLVQALQACQWVTEVHIETNGIEAHTIPRAWITCSPKTHINMDKLYAVMDEVKFLVGDGVELWKEIVKYADTRILPINMFLQPVAGPDIKKNTEEAISLCLKYPHLFRLSLQQHKLLDIR